MRYGYRSKIYKTKGGWGFQWGRSSDGLWSHKGKLLSRVGVQKYDGPDGVWWFAWFFSYGLWVAWLDVKKVRAQVRKELDVMQKGYQKELDNTEPV